MMELFKKIAAALTPSCREVVRMSSDALDRPLPPTKRFGLWLHLLLCKWCRRYGAQVRLLNRAAHDHPDKLAETIPQNLSPEARERIQQKLRAGAE
jgi:hypothetical protein